MEFTASLFFARAPSRAKARRINGLCQPASAQHECSIRSPPDWEVAGERVGLAIVDSVTFKRQGSDPSGPENDRGDAGESTSRDATPEPPAHQFGRFVLAAGARVMSAAPQPMESKMRSSDFSELTPPSAHHQAARGNPRRAVDRRRRFSAYRSRGRPDRKAAT